jgi:hypothetical protein
MVYRTEEVSFKLLIHLLPAPPQRRAKCLHMSWKATEELLYVDVNVSYAILCLLSLVTKPNWLRLPQLQIW